jgi:peptide subunit release factor RF-3
MYDQVQMKIVRTCAEQTEEKFEAVDKEIKIFKKYQNSQVENDTRPKQHFFFFNNFRIRITAEVLPDIKIYDSQKGNKTAESPVPVCVECIT